MAPHEGEDLPPVQTEADHETGEDELLMPAIILQQSPHDPLPELDYKITYRLLPHHCPPPRGAADCELDHFLEGKVYSFHCPHCARLHPCRDDARVCCRPPTVESPDGIVALLAAIIRSGLSEGPSYALSPGGLYWTGLAGLDPKALFTRAVEQARRQEKSRLERLQRELVRVLALALRARAGT